MRAARSRLERSRRSLKAKPQRAPCTARSPAPKATAWLPDLTTLLERPVSAHATLQEDVGMIHSITRQLGEDPLEVGEVQAGRTKEMIDSEGKR